MALTPRSYGDAAYQAYCRIWISGTEVTMEAGRPQRLLSFDFHQTSNFSSNTATFALYDKEWDFVERLILLSDKKIEFQFGYEGGLQSPRYQGTIFDYTPTFAIDGVKLNIVAIATGFADKDEAKVIRRSPPEWKDKRIHEIVKDIVTKPPHHLSLVFHKTAKLPAEDALETTERIEKQFTQPDMRDWAFIENVLAPLAKRESDGVGGYLFYFDDKEKKAHFHPPLLEGAVVQIFNFMRTKLSEVIQFSPGLTGNLIMNLGGGTTGITYMDRNTGKIETVFADNKTTPEKVVLGGRLTDERKPVKERYEALIVSPVKDLEEANRLVKGRYLSFFNTVYDAELVIHGYPFDGIRYQVQQIVWVNVIKRDGTLHYSSGLYAIWEIMHSIADGIFTTTFQLHRNGFPQTGGATGDAAVGHIREGKQ